MDYIQLPRFNGATTEERVKQIETFLFSAIQQYNMSMSDIKRQIDEKGEK